MAGLDLTVVPEARRDTVASALESAFGAKGAAALQAVAGGASGALTYRVEAEGSSHLLRVETIRGPLANPHQYACMQAAAEAGVAPPIRFLDAAAGVVILNFIDQRPLAEHPGGPMGAATEVAELLARVHDLPPFPSRGDHLENLAQLVGILTGSGRVATGLLDRHREALARIRAAYPWDASSFVSAHNDPNQFNVLYDGERVWLIDWETASRNDPFIDLATACSHLAPTDDLRELVLRVGLRREPGPVDHARLALMGWIVQLFAGCILLMIVVDPATPTHTDLTPMTWEDFGAAIASGALVAGTTETTHSFAKLMLASFVDASTTLEFEDALRVASSI